MTEKPPIFFLKASPTGKSERKEFLSAADEVGNCHCFVGGDKKVNNSRFLYGAESVNRNMHFGRQIKVRKENIKVKDFGF